MTRVFTETQQSLLTSVLNRIIPAEGKMPGAGDLGIVEFVENVVASDPRLRRLVNDGLAQIAIAASMADSMAASIDASIDASTDLAGLPGREFPQLGKDTQNTVLKEVQVQRPEFFEFLLRQCYNGYYTNPQIQDLIGYQRPEPGEYEYKPFDESLLEPQKRRAPFWTRV